MDRNPDALVGAAATQMAIHSGGDVAIAWLRILAQQRNGFHHLTGLAVAALRDLDLVPCGLDGSRHSAGHAFDGSYFASSDRREWQNAGKGRRAVQVHGAGT